MSNSATAPSGPDSVIISSNIDVAEIKGDSERSRSEGTHNAAVSSGLVDSRDGEGHGVRVALVSARTLSSGVSVGVSRCEMVPLFDVSEGLVVPSTLASVAASRAIKDLLLRQRVDPSSLDMCVSLDNSDGGISPTRSTSPLLSGGSVSASVVYGRRSPSLLQLLLVFFRGGGLNLGKVTGSIVLLGFILTEVSEEGNTVLNIGILVVSLGHLVNESSEVLQPKSSLSSGFVHPGVLPLEVTE